MDDTNNRSELPPFKYAVENLMETEGVNPGTSASLEEIDEMLRGESPDYLTINIPAIQLS